MVRLEPRAEPVGGKFARSVARKAEGVGN